MAATVPEYEPKCIMVTGGAGFIGSNFAIHMATSYPKARVIVLDKIAYCSSVKNLDPIAKSDNFELVKGDICDYKLITNLVVKNNIDTIVHFAAETHVDNSFGDSLVFSRSNVVGTHTLLETMRKNANIVKRFIHISTDEVYGESQLGMEDVPKAEDHALNPNNPYSASKAGAEMMCWSYIRSFNLPIVIFRGNNIYGPRQFPEKMIPKFINLLNRGKKLSVHGSGVNMRTFVHVMDIANAVDILIRKGKLGEAYNVGSQNEYSVLDVARMLVKGFGFDQDPEEKWIYFVEDRAHNDMRYHIDYTKITELGWRPEIDFQAGLKQTIDWYLRNMGNWGNIDKALVPHPKMHDEEPEQLVEDVKAVSISNSGKTQVTV